MKASVAKATFSRVVQVVALGGVGVVGAWLVGWLVGWENPLSSSLSGPTNFRLISISIAVASFSLLRHAPQVAEVTQGLDGVAKLAAGVN